MLPKTAWELAAIGPLRVYDKLSSSPVIGHFRIYDSDGPNILPNLRFGVADFLPNFPKTGVARLDDRAFFFFFFATEKLLGAI